jgi:glycerophosphoryl diester phosphodiesterase
MAERGYPLKCPENTLSSFQAAIDLNFTHTKLEVHLTKDRIPVAMRDATIDRMTAGQGKISDFTYDELLDYTINHDERIPTLEEVLHLTKGKIITAIEIKNSAAPGRAEEKVYDIIRQQGCEPYTFILSQNPRTLRNMREHSAAIQLGLITNEPALDNDLALLSELHAAYYVFRFSFEAVQTLDLQVLEHQDIQPIVATVNTIEKMKFMQGFPEILVATTELEKFQAISYPHTITDWQKVGI